MGWRPKLQLDGVKPCPTNPAHNCGGKHLRKPDKSREHLLEEHLRTQSAEKPQPQHPIPQLMLSILLLLEWVGNPILLQ